MKKIFIVVIVLEVVVAIGILVGVVFVLKNWQKTPVVQNDNNQIINSVVFTCDNEKTINAIFFKDKVELSLSDTRNMFLMQAISASGARYANSDESFVFWNKGDTAFITENNKITFENCIIKKEIADLIKVDFPKPNQAVKSPLLVTGQARGTWFFEASFPVVLTNWDGLIIAQGIAIAKDEWMTENFVPFSATLNFVVDKNAYSNKGFLILKKDNPSGLPKNDNSIEIPVVIEAEDNAVIK